MSPFAQPARGRWAVQLTLFALCCLSTFWVGAHMQGEANFAHGFAFAGTLMGILTCHEAGHYWAAKRHGIQASLPFFLPLPPGMSFGTMGAVIKMRDGLVSRDQLVDVGASGPIAGFVVALPMLAVGLHLSPLTEGPADAGVMLEGNSLLYLAAKYMVFHRVLPTESGVDVALHPMAMAAWVGLLLTMINLIPVGQLDGGHVLRGAAPYAYARICLVVHRALLGVGLLVFGYVFYESWMHPGLTLGPSLTRAFSSSFPWLIWFALLAYLRFLSGGTYHPSEAQGSLSRGRWWIVFCVALIFGAIFTPIPLRSVLP